VLAFVPVAVSAVGRFPRPIGTSEAGCLAFCRSWRDVKRVAKCLETQLKTEFNPQSGCQIRARVRWIVIANGQTRCASQVVNFRAGICGQSHALSYRRPRSPRTSESGWVCVGGLVTRGGVMRDCSRCDALARDGAHTLMGIHCRFRELL
jgi:hypothetical protein